MTDLATRQTAPLLSLTDLGAEACRDIAAALTGCWRMSSRFA